MDIEDAFTQEAIEKNDTNVADADELYLRDLITRIYSTNELPDPSGDALNVAVLCFVAGRTYQTDLVPEHEDGMMTIALTPKAVGALVNSILEQIAEAT